MPFFLSCSTTYAWARRRPALPVSRPSMLSSARTLTWSHQDWPSKWRLGDCAKSGSAASNETARKIPTRMRRIGMGPLRLNLRGKSLLHAAEFDELAAHIEAILSGRGSGDDLEWSGPLHFRVALRGNLEELIGAEVEQDELIAFEEAKAIGARLESLAADLERDFGEEVGLIFLAEAGGVAGIVDHAGENVGVVGKMNAAGVAHLNRRRLAAEENGFREEFSSAASLRR